MIPKPRLVTGLIIAGASSGGSSSVAPAMASSAAVTSPIRVLEALDASVSMNINGYSSSANIRLQKGSRINGRCYVEMFTIQGSAGIYRTRSPQVGYGGQDTNVQLEHAINEMGDFLITDKIEKEMTLKSAMKKIFSYYSEKSLLWTLGSVPSNPSDPANDEDSAGEKCVLDVDWDNCLDAIRSVMDQYPYLMLSFDFSVRPWKLNVVYRPTVVRAEGRLSRNVKSATVVRDDSELCTRVYMDGYKNKDGKPGSYTSNWAMRKYGLVEMFITGANDTPEIAERTVKSFMHTHKKPRYSVAVDGLDLSAATGEKLDSLTVGKLMRLALPDYGETITEHITEVSFPSIYKNPNYAKVSLNDEPDRVIKYIKETKKSATRTGKRSVRKAEIKDGILSLIFGDGEQVNFSKAVVLSKDRQHNAGWDDGVFTVRAFQANKEDGKIVRKEVNAINTRITSIDYQFGKSPSVSGAYNMVLPLRVRTAVDGDTGFISDFTVSGKPVYDNGWRAAFGVVKLPEEGSGSMFGIQTPTNTVGGKVTNNYVLTDDGNNAVKVSGAGNVVIAKYTHGKYTAGWVYASESVELPAAKTGSNGFYIRTPSGTLGGKNTYTFQVENMSDDTVDVYANIDGSKRIVCSFDHNKYTAGQNAVRIGTPTWASGATSESNTATFNTTAPTPQSRDLKIAMSQGDWSGGKKYVYAHHTNTNAGNRITRTEVEIPNATLNSAISTASPPSGSISIGSISLSGSTAGTYKTASIKAGGKVFTIHFGVYA